MCGIVGFNWKDEKLVQKMADLIQHRGPDDDGFYADEHISLGNRRLAIIDLKTPIKLATQIITSNIF